MKQFIAIVVVCAMSRFGFSKEPGTAKLMAKSQMCTTTLLNIFSKMSGQNCGNCSGKRLRTLRVERPYENINITGVTELTDAQNSALKALGAVEI
jgi:hypothetical protein